MLIDACLTVAYKCSSCGAFEFFNISLFRLLYKKECSLSCHCGCSCITITGGNSRYYKLDINCIGCGNTHSFVLGRQQLLGRHINAFRCPLTGMEQCFIGNDEAVRKRVDSLERKLDELMDMLGYDSYFKNSRVMVDSLNKIHDIAEQGDLYCECGNNDIELLLLPDRIALNCKKCPGSGIVYAATNEDLKDTMTRHNILLVNNYPGYDTVGSSSLLRKINRK